MKVSFDRRGSGPRSRARQVTPALLGALLIVGAGLMGLGSGALSGLKSDSSVTGPPSPLTARPSLESTSPGYFHTNASGNISISVLLSGGVNGGPLNLSAPSNVTVRYWFKVLNYDASVDQGLVVRVPQTVAIFAIQSGDLNVTAPAQTFSLSSSGNSTPAAGFGYLNLNHPVKFKNSTLAVFSSQLVAVTTTLPWEAVALQFQWNWSFQESGKPPESQKNNVSQKVIPDQSATLASTSRTPMSSGQPFTACLSGPVEGRTFSLRAETVNGTQVTDFVQVNATVPAVTPLPFCWSAMIPPSIVAPQTIIVHIWDFQNAYTSNVTTLLLFAIPVKIVNATSSPSHTFLGASVSLWLTFATVGIGVFAVALIGGAIYLSRRRRRQASAASPPAGAVVQLAGADSDAQPVAPTDVGEGLRGPRNQ